MKRQLLRHDFQTVVSRNDVITSETPQISRRLTDGATRTVNQLAPPSLEHGIPYGSTTIRVCIF